MPSDRDFRERQKLALFHAVAAVDIELFHRRGDLGHDILLIARQQRAVAGDDVPDGVLGHCRDLDRDRSVDFLLSFLEQLEVRMMPAVKRRYVAFCMIKMPP